MNIKLIDNTVLAFSNDGVYWAYMIIDKTNGRYSRNIRIRR